MNQITNRDEAAIQIGIISAILEQFSYNYSFSDNMRDTFTSLSYELANIKEFLDNES